MDTYIKSDDSSFAGISDVGSMTAKKADGKRDLSKVQMVAAARRQAKRNAPEMRQSWNVGSTPYNPWGAQLKNSIEFTPKAIYESTPVRIDGLDNGSSIYVQAGDLLEHGFTTGEILNGNIHWDDVEQLIADRELDYEYMM